MSYESENWPRLSPRRRDAHNALRAARGQPPIAPPKVDEYVPPKPSAHSLHTVDYGELVAEYRAATSRFDAALRGGAEGFAIKGGQVDGLEVVELPNGMGFEGVAEGRRGTIHVDHGFTIRR